MDYILLSFFSVSILMMGFIAEVLIYTAKECEVDPRDGKKGPQI